MSNKTIKPWAAAAMLAGITLTNVSGQQLIQLINDTDLTKSGTTDYTYTTSSGTTYYNIFTSAGVSAGAGRLIGDGSNLKFGASDAQVTLYRPFDNGFSLKLGDMKVGEILSLSFTAKVYALGSTRQFAYGFIDNSGLPLSLSASRLGVNSQCHQRQLLLWKFRL